MKRYRFFILAVMLLLSAPLLLASCTQQQLRAGTYEALHKREQIRCQEQGRHDCPEYPRYPDYERMRKQAED